MASPQLIAVAGDHDGLGSLLGEMANLGARVTEVRHLGQGRVLVLAEAGPTPPDDVAALVAKLRSRGLVAVARPRGGGLLEAWQNHAKPTLIEDRLAVCFPWSEFDRDHSPPMVEIDPGGSFGAGNHPSTRLLLAELSRRIVEHDRVLDVGCGTGVLALAAARLGAGRVVGLDIIPEAVVAARANARRNGLAGVARFSEEPLASHAGSYDVVVANLSASTLVELAPAVVERLAPAGWLGVSGISPAQVSVVVAAYPLLELTAVSHADDFTAAVLTRPDTR